MGLFVVFEGVDHSGKTSLLIRIKKILQEKFLKIFTTFEPGEGLSVLRQILLYDKKTLLTPEAELLLFLADRHQHLKKILLPNLNKNDVLLCDRYFYSTFIYQGLIKKIDSTLIFNLHQQLGLFQLLPDLVFFLHLDWKVWQTRNSSTNQKAKDAKITISLGKGSYYFQKIQKYYQVFFTKKLSTLFSAQQNHLTEFVTIDVKEKNLECLAKEIAEIIYQKWKQKAKK